MSKTQNEVAFEARALCKRDVVAYCSFLVNETARQYRMADLSSRFGAVSSLPLSFEESAEDYRGALLDHIVATVSLPFSLFSAIQESSDD